jgi:hypothetical protein
MCTTMKRDSSGGARGDGQCQRGSHEASECCSFQRALSDVCSGDGGRHITFGQVDAIFNRGPSGLAQAHMAADMRRCVDRDVRPGPYRGLHVEPPFYADRIDDLLHGPQRSYCCLCYRRRRTKWWKREGGEARREPSIDGFESISVELIEVNQLEPLKLLPFGEPRKKKCSALVPMLRRKRVPASTTWHAFC